MQTSVYTLENSVTNMAFHDYSSHTFTADELFVLGQGLNFVPTPRAAEICRSDFNRFERSVYLGDYFHELDTARRSPDQECPPNFRIPNPSWHPRSDAEDYVASEGVPEFCEEVLSDLNSRAELQPRRLPNLSRKLVGTIRRLKADQSLTIVDTDKQLGPAAIDTDVYIERVQREMADTHIIDHRDADDILASICDRMKAELKPELASLPPWAAEYIEESFSCHPRTREPYRIPGCRDLLKVHKPVLGDRLVTGNHCAATQPGSRLLAELIDPIVRATPTYVQDAVSCIRCLREQRVAESTLVITYDVVKLYPSIVHDLCQESVAAELSAASVPWLRFALVMLEIVLSENFCQFAGIIYKQITGFATGTACAAQAAHLHLEHLMAPLFAAAAQFVQFHRRYIDDGFILWTGTREEAIALFQQLNALHPSLELTFEISDWRAIFLDFVAWKGPHWQQTGFLDIDVYQKPVCKFLYLPFRSETPRSTLRGMIVGELIRFITHSTSYLAFLRIAKLFWFRLRARGYPHAFLQRAFASAPLYQERDSLLQPRPKEDGSRMFALILTYSYALARLRLPEIIHRHKDLLPQHLRSATFIQAWRNPRNLGRTLIPFTLHKHDPPAAPLTPAT